MDPDQAGSLSLEIWLLVAVVATAQGLGLHPVPSAVDASTGVGAARSLSRPAAGSGSSGWLQARTADEALSAPPASRLAAASQRQWICAADASGVAGRGAALQPEAILAPCHIR